MKIGKLASVGIALALVLTGCASPSPKASQSPTSTPSETTAAGTPITDEKTIQAFMDTVTKSCERAKEFGLAVEIPDRNEAIFTSATKQEFSSPSGSDMITRSGTKYELGGWPSGDPLCGEAGWVKNVEHYAKDDPTNEAGDYALSQISQTEYAWTVHRGSPEFNPYAIEIKDGWVTRISANGGYVYEISYGPLSKEIQAAFKKTLAAAGHQYMHLGDQLWNMTFAQAKVFCRKHGLTLVKAEEDNVMLMPSGTAGPFNPKRMNVNVMSGKIVGIWPG